MKKRLFTFGTLLALMLLAAFLPGFSMKTFAREKIYTIEAVGDDFRSVFGENKPTTGLTLTVTEGAPAYINNLYPNSCWMRENPDGSWAQTSGTFYHGVWCYQIMVRLDGSAVESYEFADNVVCRVNGEKWYLDQVVNMSSFCNAFFYSPAITLVQPLDYVSVTGVSPLVEGMAPSTSGLTVTSDGATIDSSSVFWLRDDGLGWYSNNSAPVDASASYQLRFLLNSGESSLVGPNTSVYVDGYPVSTYLQDNGQLSVTCSVPVSMSEKGTFVVTSGALNVRGGANANAGRISGLSYGDIIDGRLCRGWVAFDCGGQTGWVDRRYLALTDRNYAINPEYYQVINSGSLNVRSYPLLDNPPSNRIGGVKEGDYVLATGFRYDEATERAWLLIDYPGEYGHQLGYVMYYKEDDHGNYYFYMDGTFIHPNSMTKSLVMEEGFKPEEGTLLKNVLKMFSGRYELHKAK